MQRVQRGPYEVRPLAGVQDEQAQLVDEPEVLVQARLQLLRLRLHRDEVLVQYQFQQPASISTATPGDALMYAQPTALRGRCKT